MKANNNNNQEERIKKATELLQQSWWFTWFLIIAPLTTALAGFFIFNLLRVGLYISLSFSVIIFMFALLFFYKAYDKYRKNPFFLNKYNNLTARIHIIFLISILSFIVPPIFIIISPKGISFTLLPLISYAVLYNIVYYYFNFQPIDFYDLEEQEFKHSVNFHELIKQPYNFIIVINYIGHLIFLSFTFATNLAWLFGLISNTIFYIITLTSTKSHSRKIRDNLREEKPSLKEITLFKQKYVVSLVSMIFILLIQMPTIIIITYSFLGVQYSAIEYINGSFLTIFFIVLYLKIRIYIFFHYNSIQMIFNSDIEKQSKMDDDKLNQSSDIRYQKQNTILSFILISLMVTLAFLIKIPYLILIISPFFHLFFRYEQKANFSPKKYNKYIFLLNSVAILISFSFGIFSIFSLNIQVIIFLLSMYFLLQVFVKFEYFSKDSIILFQNLLAVVIFFIIAYSFYPTIISEYLIFTDNPLIISISIILIGWLLIPSIVLLITLYISYARFFYVKHSKSFRRFVLIDIFLIESFFYILINLRIFFLVETLNFLQVLIISSILFPLIFIVFITANLVLGIFPIRNLLISYYYSFWVLISTVFISIISTNFNNFPILALDFLLLSVSLYYILKLGLKIEKIKDKPFKKFNTINSYCILFELFFLFYSLFFNAFQALLLFDKIIYSVYLSMVIICLIFNIFAHKGIFAETLYIKINAFIIVYSSLIAFYYFLFVTINTFYVFVIPLMVSSIILFIPIFYLKKKKLYSRIIAKALVLNSILLSVTITLIPTVVGLEIFYVGLVFDSNFLILTVINFTLYLLFLILTIINLLSTKAKIRETRVKLIQKVRIIIEICLSFTTLFYYPFFLLRETIYCTTFPVTFTSCFLFIPLYLSYKNAIFDVNKIKRYILINGLILTGLLTSIPVLVGLDIISSGIYFHFNIVVLTILDLSLLIFFICTVAFSYFTLNFKLKGTYVLFLYRLKIITLLYICFITIFGYPYLLLIGTLYNIILPLIFSFCFVYILLYYSYKKGIFNLNQIRRCVIFNTLILTGLLTSIPTFVGLNIIYSGILLEFSFFILNVLNSTLYIFFGCLMILFYLTKEFNLNEKYILSQQRSHIITLLIICFTSFFCYPFIILQSTIFSIVLSSITLLSTWFLVFFYASKRNYFNEDVMKRLTILAFLILLCLSISVPAFIGLELIRVFLISDLFLIITSSVFLLFCFLKISELISLKINLKDKYIRKFIFCEIFSWFFFTISLSIYILAITFIGFGIVNLTFLILSSSFFVFFILNMHTLKLVFNYLPDLASLKYLHDLIVYGIITSVSLIFLSLNLFRYVFTEQPLLNLSLNFGLFFTIFGLFLKLCDNLTEFKFSQFKVILELIVWFSIKIILCILISSLIGNYIYQFFILNHISLFLLTFTFFTPISLYILRNLKYISSENLLLMKRITLLSFIASLLSLYCEVFYTLSSFTSFFNLYSFIQITLIIVNLILIIYYFIVRFTYITQDSSVIEFYRIYLSSFILFISLLFFNSILLFFSILVSYVLILSKRSRLTISKFLSYFLLSYVTFVEFIAILKTYNIIIELSFNLIGIFIIIYLLALTLVLSFSILLNLKKNNGLEKYLLYSIIPNISFGVLNILTNILVIYNITISLFIFLFLIGIQLYRQNDERYKWFIKPCIILFIFDLVSFMSYSWLFNNQIFELYSPVLTFTLTASFTGFGFVLLYNDSPRKFRKTSFLIVLSSIILSFPIFVYFLIIASLSLPLLSIVPLIFAINFSVFLFYFSLGVFQWRISWAIWKSGWYAWMILPLVNFFVIYQSFTGIDVLTNSLRFGIYDVQGSLILSIITCSILYLPVLYTKIKEYFSQIIFIIWGESLFLLYWVSQNLFVRDLLLRNLLFALFAVILLVPLVSRFKYWRINSFLWLIITGINASFLLFYLTHIGIPFGITISIDILVIGLFLIIYSFFPNIRSIGTILITAYFITILGIFLTIYFILLSIILNPVFSVNIALIITGFSLYSSKYVKVSKRIIDLFLSWILIFSFSWLTFNTFSLASEFLIFAFSLSLTVFGCSFYVFNHYKMKIPINRIIPYLVVTVGSALSITSLSSVLLNITPGVILSIFTTVIIIYMYYLITEYRYILLFLIPIPITAPILEIFIKSEVIHPYWFLTWAMLYLLTFQFIFNLFKGSASAENKERNSFLKLYEDKKQIIRLNVICFILNSFCISLFISIIFPIYLHQLLITQIIVIYQICDFLIIWPFLLLFCLKYLEKSDLDLKFKDLLAYFSKFSFGLYLLIPISAGIHLFLQMIYLNFSIIIAVYYFLLFISGVMFIEGFLLDKRYFYFLLNSTRNKLILWSWFILSNVLSVFLYILHKNIFFFGLSISILNLITLYFLSDLDVSKQKISIGRIILIYNSFIWSSFFISSLISAGLVLLFEELSGVPYWLLLIQNSSLILYGLSYFFVKSEKKLNYQVEFTLFILFQGFFALNWVLISSIFGTLDIPMIILIILIETGLLFKTIKNFNAIAGELKYPNLLETSYSFLTLFLYLESSLLMYFLLIEFLGVFESIIISLFLLFLFTLIDVYFLNKIKRNYARLIHTVSYFSLSLVILLSIYRFLYQNPYLLSLEIFIFIIMQFYTNYSFFASLSSVYTEKKESLKKTQFIIQEYLGIGFYLTLFLLILQTLLLNRIEFQLIILILSVLVHGLMIIDNFIFKFLKKSSKYLITISWGFIMIFTSINMIGFYLVNFIEIISTIIPLVIFILILEFTYIFKLMDFWKLISRNKEKIRFYLYLLTYINFITWPLYFASTNLLLTFNLIIFSLLIMLIITYVDDVRGFEGEYIILKENSQNLIRSFSFLSMGGLLSIDVFMLLNLVPLSNFFLNLNTALFVFVIFLGIKLKPFKEHSLKAFFFWSVVFLQLSIFLYHLSLSYVISGVAFSLMILVYPFVFLLEELREIFSKILDKLIMYYRKFRILMKNTILKIFNFIKTHAKHIWLIACVFISIFSGLLFSELFLNLLNWIHATLLMFPIFGLLYSVTPASKSEDVDVMFKRRMLRLIIGWGSVIGVLFGFIAPVWYIFATWISIWILGAVLLPYMSFKEKREKISIKWRFYTLLILIIMLVLFGILFGIQIYMNFI